MDLFASKQIRKQISSVVYLASCQSPAIVGKSSIHIYEGNPTNLHFLRLAGPKLLSFASWAPHVMPWMFGTCKEMTYLGFSWTNNQWWFQRFFDLIILGEMIQFDCYPGSVKH